MEHLSWSLWILLWKWSILRFLHKIYCDFYIKKILLIVLLEDKHFLIYDDWKNILILTLILLFGMEYNVIHFSSSLFLSHIFVILSLYILSVFYCYLYPLHNIFSLRNATETSFGVLLPKSEVMPVDLEKFHDFISFWLSAWGETPQIQKLDSWSFAKIITDFNLPSSHFNFQQFYLLEYYKN